MVQLVKNLPAMQETQVRSLGWEDPWSRKWQATPVFLPGEPHGQRSLVGYSPWGRKELDMTEAKEHTCVSVPGSGSGHSWAGRSWFKAPTRLQHCSGGQDLGTAGLGAPGSRSPRGYSIAQGWSS